MWLGHDLGWWAFVFTVVGLFLMLPVSMAANVLTPKLQNWWAERSAASLRKRIRRLQVKLDRYERTPLFSHFEYSALFSIEKGERTLWVVEYTIVSLLLVVLLELYRLTGQKNSRVTIAVFVVALAINVLRNVSSGSAYEVSRLGTEWGRNQLRASIEKLKQKLAAKG